LAISSTLRTLSSGIASSSGVGSWPISCSICRDVRQNYMRTRETRQALKDWLDTRVQAKRDLPINRGAATPPRGSMQQDRQ
jgi:hypothetical protein